jgi:hypothetical protein
MVNEQDYVDLGLNCAGVCYDLYRGLKKRRLEEPSRPALEAMVQLLV